MTTATAPAAAPPRPTADRTERVGWLLVLVLTVAVGVTWLPLSAPFGNDHDGRTLVLNAIQVEQVRERGLLATDLGSSLAPYVESTSYAHHPPAMKLAYLGASVLPVSLETSTRLVSYSLGLLTLPALALLLRRLRVPWGAVLPALAVVAAVPLFWAYGRIHGPLGATVLLAAVVADLRTRDEVPTRRLVGSCLLAAFVVAANWFGMAVAALLGLWLLAGRRRLDRVVVALGATMAVAAVVTLAWVVGLSGTQDVAASIGERATAVEFTRAQWGERMVRWVDELVPAWWQLVALLSLTGAVAVRRVRVVALASLVLAVGWIAGLPGGSFVHDYWILPVVLPVALGVAGLLAVPLAGAGRRLDLGVAGVATVLGVLAVVGLDAGAVGEEYEDDPRDMPVAAAAAVPPASQELAWHAPQIPGRLTVAWAWDRPAAALADPAEVAPDTLVMVRLDRPPRYARDVAAVRAAAVAVEGDYAVVRAGDLAALAGAGS